jgi:hypothetical protein
VPLWNDPGGANAGLLQAVPQVAFSRRQRPGDVLEHLTGVNMPRATLDREARRQGQRAEQLRTQMDEKAVQAKPRVIQKELALGPYQMILRFK